jgi:hypothetical protein
MNNAIELIGRNVIVRANDFVDAPLRACVRFLDPATNSLLLEFVFPHKSSGVAYSHAVASSRLQRDSLDTLTSRGVLASAVTWIPDFRFNPDSPFDLNWWRGGGAAITDIVLTS